MFTYPLTKTCLFSKSLPQKTHIHKDSPIISHTKYVFSITLFYRKFTYPVTQNMPSFANVHISPHQNMPFFKVSSTENSHIFPHKPCLLSKSLPQNVHISSHTKHVFSITLLYRQFFHPLTKNMSFCMPYFTRNHISSHQTHALFQWLFHTKFNSHIFPHKPCLLSIALPQITHISSHTNHALFQRLFHRKIHASSHPTHVFFTCLLSMKQRQHMLKSCQGK